MYDVVVVVLNWNGWPDTVRCLQSLEETDYEPCQVVVVDNGSTDDSVVRLRSLCRAVVLETGKNLGFAGGNNVGIRYALEQGARYVWILNNDTVVARDALSALVRAAERDPDIGAVGAVIWAMDGSRVLAHGGGCVDLRNGRSWYVTDGKNDVAYITGASMLIRTDALHKVGLFDERFFLYWEDTDLSFRLRAAGWRLAVAADARVWHRESGTVGEATYLKGRYYSRGLVLFLRKHTRTPVVPAVRALRREIARAVRRRQWEVQRAVVRGWLEGWLA